jgi:hypothetical protein
MKGTAILTEKEAEYLSDLIMDGSEVSGEFIRRDFEKNPRFMVELFYKENELKNERKD